MFVFVDTSGITHSFTRESQKLELDKLYATGFKVQVAYVMQKHKKAFIGGSLDTKVVIAIQIQSEQEGRGNSAALRASP